MPLPLLWISLAFLAGILVASAAHLSLYLWLALLVITLIGAALVGRLHITLPAVRLGTPSVRISASTAAIGIAALAAMFLGAARYQVTVKPLAKSQLAWFNDAGYEVMVTGTMVAPPDVRDNYANLRLQAREIDTGDGAFQVNGLLLAQVDPNQDYQYGEILRLRGRLETPPSNEDFSYRDYLARQGILSYMRSAETTQLPGFSGSRFLWLVYAARQASLRNVYRLFVDPEASLLAGILLGVDTGLPAKLEQAFNDTGTSHIIAISGFNIAVIAGVFAVMFNRLLGPRLGALAAAAGIIAYTIFVGPDPTVVRAAITGAVALLAVQVGRRQQGLNTLAFVAAVMALWNPLYLWDVGFQLSFFATLGIILYGGPFMKAAADFIGRHFRTSDAEKIASVLGQFVLLTLAAQLTTLPIIAYHFKQISLVSPLANAFILPAQPAVMVLGGLAVFISLFIYPLGQLAAWIAWPLTAYTIRMVELFARVPSAVVYLGGFSLGFVALFYVVLFAITFARPQLRQFYESVKARFRFLSLTTALVALFICAVLTWRLAAAAPDGRLHVTFLNVGTADAVLIQTPTGRRVLINGGPSTSALSEALGRRSSLIDHRLDWLVVASTDENQVAALPRLLPRYPPSHVLLAGQEQASFSSQALAQWLQDQAIPVTVAETGQALDLGDAAKLKVLDVSPRGATLLLEWQSFRVLLPIGANLDTLDHLENGKDVGLVSALLLSQSGYAPLTPQAWLENLNPRLVVISVAPVDKDGLPGQETLDALKAYAVLRTDVNGWIELTTDGTQLWVRAEKLPPAVTPTP